jgi:hypothetical protein
MLIQFEVSYDMGKQTIEGPKKWWWFEYIRGANGTKL